MLFWHDRSLDRLPSIESALQSIDIRETLISQFLRHTGAGVLVRSGTIDDRELILGKCRQRVEALRIDAYVASDALGRLVVGMLRSGIKNRHRLMRIDMFLELRR